MGFGTKVVTCCARSSTASTSIAACARAAIARDSAAATRSSGSAPTKRGTHATHHYRWYGNKLAAGCALLYKSNARRMSKVSEYFQSAQLALLTF